MSARFSPELLRSAAPAEAEDGAWYHEPARSLATSPVPLVTTAEADVATSEAPSTVAERFVPDHYEAKYAYPLIVWLQPEGSPTREFPKLMRRISDRNFVGAAVHPQAEERLEDRLVAAITGMRRQYHIHSERIFLAGVGEFATQALRIGLDHPEWFGGVIAISPQSSGKSRLLSRFADLQGKRVLLATDDQPTKVAQALRTQQLLWSAGMSVRACQFTGGEGIDRGLLREIDRWVIAGICE